MDNKLEILTRWQLEAKRWKFMFFSLTTNLDETFDLNVQQFNAERYFNNSLSFGTDCEKLIKKLSSIDRKPLSAGARSILLVYTVFIFGELKFEFLMRFMGG